MEQEVQFWLAMMQNESTRKQYADRFAKYEKWTGMSATELLELKKNSNDNEAELLLDKFMSMAPLTEHMKLNIIMAVRSFYKTHYQDLKKKAGQMTATRKRAYRVPTQKRLKRFFNGAFTMRDRALIPFIASTFIREGSIPLLKIKHVEGLWEELNK